MREIVIVTPGHKYAIPHLDGEGETVIQFVQRPPHHEAVPGIVLQDLFRIGIDRLQVLDKERPWFGNQASIQDLRNLIARQEARALMEAVKAGKLDQVELLRMADNGHLDWEMLR